MRTHINLELSSVAASLQEWNDGVAGSSSVWTSTECFRAPSRQRTRNACCCYVIQPSVTDEHSLRWSSVSAVRPATAQTFTLREALTMACRAALVGQAVHQHV
jgi:hypothetical protein